MEKRFTLFVMKDYSPEVLDKLRGPKGYLGYWINKTLDLDTKNIRILTAEDDYINYPGVALRMSQVSFYLKTVALVSEAFVGLMRC